MFRACLSDLVFYIFAQKDSSCKSVHLKTVNQTKTKNDSEIMIHLQKKRELSRIQSFTVLNAGLISKV